MFYNLYVLLEKYLICFKCTINVGELLFSPLYIQWNWGSCKKDPMYDYTDSGSAENTKTIF